MYACSIYHFEERLNGRLLKPTVSRQVSVRNGVLHIPPEMIDTDLAQLGVTEKMVFGEWKIFGWSG